MRFYLAAPPLSRGSAIDWDLVLLVRICIIFRNRIFCSFLPSKYINQIKQVTPFSNDIFWMFRCELRETNVTFRESSGRLAGWARMCTGVGNFVRVPSGAYDLSASTAQTRQRLFFSFCDHSSSSFAIENNWVRPHPPERSSKIWNWIQKFRCQNSNLNLPTIKNGFCGYSYLKDPLRILKRTCAQFWNRLLIPVT